MSQETKQIDNGGPAFPTEIGGNGADANLHQTGPNTAQFYGMTLRDYFAAKAMQAFLVACHERYSALPKYAAIEADWCDTISRDAYTMADAMLKARKP